MKKKVFWVAAMVCCIGFSSMNVVKSGIKNLQFLMTVSSETLANAEAIEDGEGGEGEAVEIKRWNRYWDKCTFYKGREYTVQFGSSCGVTIKQGDAVPGIVGKREKVKEGGMFKEKPEAPECADAEKPADEPWIS